MAVAAAQQAQHAAQQAAQNPQPQPQPNGQPPQAGGSAPSFSLTEGGMDEEEGEDAEAS